jgi:hypothetical protein
MPFRSARRICLLPTVLPAHAEGTDEPVSGSRADRVMGAFCGIGVAVRS